MKGFWCLFDENRTFIFFKKQGMFKSPAILNSYGKVRILGENMKKNRNHDFCGLGKSVLRFEGNPRNG